MRIAIFGNSYQEAHIEALTRFFERLNEFNVWLMMEESFHDYLCKVLPTPPRVYDIIHDHDFSAALAISFGGDGTFLHTAQWVGEKEIPILGINTGHLGYLADARLENTDALIDDLLNERFKIERRALIEARCVEETIGTWPYALNEIAILKQDTASMINIHTTITGTELTTYVADGLIVSTPTGSTGYNLSIGGPIIEPTAPCWAVSPIAAHSLTMRPLVVSNDSILSLTTTSRSASYRLSIDGRSVTLPQGSTITLNRAPFCIRVVQRLDHHFADTLRTKLLWGIDKR